MVATKGAVASSLTALYKALGGGWEIRMGSDFVTEDQKNADAGAHRAGAACSTSTGRSTPPRARRRAPRRRAAGSSSRAWWPWW